MKKVIFLSVAVLLVFVYQSAFAHHAWIEKDGNRFLVGWGHPPKVDPYEPNKVKDIKGFDLNGKETVLKRTDEKDRVYLSASTGISMIALSFEGGYLVSTPDGKKRLTKKEAQKVGMQILDSIFSTQSAKTLFAYSNAAEKPVGLKLEIIPLANTYSLKGDGLLPIKVLFEGKPVEGVTIETGNHKEVAKTDKDGLARIQAGQGKQIILAKHRLAGDGIDADFISFTTVLTIEAK